MWRRWSWLWRGSGKRLRGRRNRRGRRLDKKRSTRKRWKSRKIARGRTGRSLLGLLENTWDVCETALRFAHSEARYLRKSISVCFLLSGAGYNVPLLINLQTPSNLVSKITTNVWIRVKTDAGQMCQVYPLDCFMIHQQEIDLNWTLIDLPSKTTTQTCQDEIPGSMVSCDWECIFK